VKTAQEFQYVVLVLPVGTLLQRGYSTSIVTEYGNEFHQALLAYNVVF
jgi:hypothetical protein